MISYMKIILNCPASQLNPFKYSFKVRGMTVQQENYIYWHLSFSLISVPCFCMYLFNRGRISSVGRALDCRAGGRGFDSRGRTNTQGLKNN